MSRPGSRLPGELSIHRTTDLFAALAHPMRLRLLLALSRRGPMAAGELQAAVAAEQSAVSHQLAILKRQRLVSVERDGRRRVYHLRDHHVAHIIEDAVKHANERDRRTS